MPAGVSAREGLAPISMLASAVRTIVVTHANDERARWRRSTFNDIRDKLPPDRRERLIPTSQVPVIHEVFVSRPRLVLSGITNASGLLSPDSLFLESSVSAEQSASAVCACGSNV